MNAVCVCVPDQRNDVADGDRFLGSPENARVLRFVRERLAHGRRQLVRRGEATALIDAYEIDQKHAARAVDDVVSARPSD